MRFLISARWRRASWLLSILAVLAIVPSINPSAALGDQRPG
jgi:hypothetical protein